MSIPPIEDGSLMAYWDGAISAETRRRIETSPELFARARQLRAGEVRLARTLRRVTCPSTEELGDYQHGLLDGEAGHRIARHAVDCPHCSRELVQMAELMDYLRDDESLGIAERIQRILADLVSGPPAAGAGPAWAMPAPVGLRGHEEARSWVYRAGDYQIALMADEDLEASGRMQLTGLLSGPELEGWRAELRDESEVLRVVPVDEFGNFALLGVNRGAHEVHLIGGAFALSIQEVVI